MKKLKNIKQQYVNIAIIGLAVLALALGAVIYFKNTPSNQPTQQANNTRNTPIDPNVDIGNMSQEELEQAVLNAPSQDASQEERRTHFIIAQTVAQDGTEITIENCKADPIVLKVEQGKDITVYNEGSESSTLQLGPSTSITIPAGDSTTISTDGDIIDKGPGLYGFGCNTQPGAQGFILVTPTN